MNCMLPSSVLILTFYSYLVQSKLTLEHAIQSLNNNPRQKYEESLQFLRGRSSNRPRNKLPEDWTNGNKHPFKKLECGETYNIAKEGYLKFVFDSKHEGCYAAFIGSRRKKCTVAFYCDGTITFDPPTDSGCQQEYLVLGDGTTGEIAGCDTFSFGNIPRKPRNGGHDIFMYYKGQSLDSPCVVFCGEDLNLSQSQLLKPRKLLESSRYAGFPSAGSCVCGKRRNDKGRVVGGETAFKFEFPWLAALVYKKYPSLKRVPKCGAALINDLFAITAAHCFNDQAGEEFQIILHAHVMDKYFTDKSWTEKDAALTPGWNLTKQNDRSEDSIRVTVEKVIIHPHFVPESTRFDYDIAILKLKKRVNLEKGSISPICLPYMNEIRNYTENDMFVAAGWGRSSETAGVITRVVQKVDLPFIPYPTCKSYGKPSHTHICAGDYQKGGTDTCEGDSGGPLIYKFDDNKGQYMLTGIVSAGVGCARQYSPGLYTDVEEVLQWIYHHTATGDALWCSR